MRSVRVTVEVLGTGIQESGECEIDTLALDRDIRNCGKQDQAISALIVEKELIKGVIPVAARQCECIMDRLPPWIRDVEQKVKPTIYELDDEARMLAEIRKRGRVRLTNLSSNECEIIRRMVGDGVLTAENIGGEEFVSSP